jgi:hypothetical protein
VIIDGNSSPVFAAGTGYGAPVVATYTGTIARRSARASCTHAHTYSSAIYMCVCSGTGTVAGDSSCAQPSTVSAGLQLGSLECGLTSGMQFVEIEGQNFGSPELRSSMVVTYGVSGTELVAAGCTITEAHVKIRCNTVPGAGAGLKWTVIVGTHEVPGHRDRAHVLASLCSHSCSRVPVCSDGLRSVAPTTSYAPPKLVSLDGPGAAFASTYGGELVHLAGENFGPPENQTAYFSGVFYGRYQARDCVVESHARITCRTVPGIGHALPWSVRIAGQTSMENIVTSYSAPAIYGDMGDASWLTPGLFTVTLNGTNVGLNQLGVAVDVEIDGLRSDVVTVKVESALAGELVNPDPSDDSAVSQLPDTLTFIMPPGRGQGLVYRLVVRDQLRSVINCSCSLRRLAAFLSLTCPSLAHTLPHLDALVDGVTATSRCVRIT